MRDAVRKRKTHLKNLPQNGLWNPLEVRINMNPKTGKHLHKLVERYFTFFLGVEFDNPAKILNGKINLHYTQYHLNVTVDEDVRSDYIQRIESRGDEHFFWTGLHNISLQNRRTLKVRI